MVFVEITSPKILKNFYELFVMEFVSGKVLGLQGSSFTKDVLQIKLPPRILQNLFNALFIF